MEELHPGPEIEQSGKIENTAYKGQRTSIDPHHDIVYGNAFKLADFPRLTVNKLTAVRITSAFEEIEVQMFRALVNVQISCVHAERPQKTQFS